MKRFLSILALLFTMTVTANSMSYEQAREQALFLTDKMAYELNLTDDQYEAAYEINLDYLMGINNYDDLYGAYWRQRNLDLSYILLSWQYKAFCDALYFYRPLYWNAGYWHFRVYARYPHRDYYFFNRPRVFVSYRGGHSWRHNGGRSWYKGRDYGPRPGREHFGMRDGFDRGDYGRGNRQTFGNRKDNNNQSFGSRQSSTRTTVTRPSTSSSFGGRRPNSAVQNKPSNTFTPSQTTRPSSTIRFGGNRGSSSSSSVPFNRKSTQSETTKSTESNFGTRRSSFSTSRPSQTFTRPSTSDRQPSVSRGSSFGGSRNSGASMSRQSSGSSRPSGGGRFGGRR